MTLTPPETPENPELAAPLRAALAQPVRRVRALDLPDGRRFWLKRIERMSLALRLQKGDPARQFRAEREGLHLLAESGMPVPVPLAEGADYMLLPDAGPNLMELAGDATRSEADRLAGFAAAGRSLALLHWAGMSHGRPAVRDICWDGDQARFIDLENFRRSRRGGFWQARDVLILSHSADVQWADRPIWIETLLQGYAANAPDGATARVGRLARRLAPLGWLAGPLLRLRPKSRELRAVPLTLDRLSRL